MSVKLTTNEIRYISLFETITSATVKDCIIDDEHNKVTFLVKKGDMGLAIGKRGSTIGKMQKSVEFSTDAKGNKIATLDVDSKTKRAAIGKNGQNIQRARQFAKRQFEISDIIIK